MPRPAPRRCAVVKGNGEPCQKWARPASEPPRCSEHAGYPAKVWPARYPRVACSATTAAGRPCRQFALLQSDPPLCASHAHHGGGGPVGNEHARTHGFYARQDVRTEVVRVMQPGTPALEREIVVMQVALQRLLEALQAEQERSDLDLVRLAQAAFAGGRAMARMLLAKKNLEPPAKDEWEAVMDQALGQINEEEGWAVKL